MRSVRGVPTVGGLDVWGGMGWCVGRYGVLCKTFLSFSHSGSISSASTSRHDDVGTGGELCVCVWRQSPKKIVTEL